VSFDKVLHGDLAAFENGGERGGCLGGWHGIYTESMGAGDGGHGVDYDGKADIKSYKSEDNVDNHMPQKGLGAGMYGEEDNAQHESGKLELVHTFARAQNPTARGVTPALG